MKTRDDLDRFLTMLKARTNRNYHFEVEEGEPGWDVPDMYVLVETDEEAGEGKLTPRFDADGMFQWLSAFDKGFVAGNTAKWICDCDCEENEHTAPAWWCHNDYANSGTPICGECGSDMVLA